MTKLKQYSVLPFLALSLAVSSCINCIDGNGTFKIEDRTSSIKTFTEVELCGSYRLEITQDSVQSVVIEGDENILPEITTTVSGQRLIVESKSHHCLNFDHSLVVKISVPTLESVTINGSGSVYCDSFSTSFIDFNIEGSGDIKVNRLSTTTTTVSIEGSGDVKLEGTSINTIFEIDGSGDIRASNLIQESCNVNISGSGSIYTHFTKNLSGVINGSGDIYYIGPSDDIDISIHGSGNIINNN